MLCTFQILSKADDNTVMETVDPEVLVTCVDISHVRKTFQLALLCTKCNPSDRPTMHEVSKILVSLLPASVTKSFVTTKPTDYTKLLLNHGHPQLQSQAVDINTSSDAHWFIRFRDAISNNTL